MPRYCCVPQCKNNGTLPGISFHLFPKDEELKKQWIIKTRRDYRRNISVSNSMRVCSGHFVPSDFREVVNGSRNCLNKDAVPSVFTFTSPRKLKPSRRRVDRVPQVHAHEWTAATNLNLDRQAPSEDVGYEPSTSCSPMPNPQTPTNVEEECVSKPTPSAEELQAEIEKIQMKRVAARRQTTILEATVDSLKKELATANSLLKVLQTERDSKIQACASKSDFDMAIVKRDTNLLTYYTGFDSLEVYEIFHDFINPGRTISHSSKLSEENQMLLVLSKLRQGFDNVDLSFRFNISTSLVSQIFVNWINEMYYRLGCLNIWPHRDIIFKNAPQVFKEKYPTCIIILDGTEMKIECPSSLVLQSQTYSSYKSSNTVKGLVGCDPKGGIIFISQLYTGSISDKRITQESGLYDCLRRKLESQHVRPGDVVMVDKGFNILKEIQELGLTLNIPPMASTEQFTEEEVYDTRKIASCRVHVERVIRRVKTYKILTGVIPVTSLPHMNQIWTVCCILSGFRCVTKCRDLSECND